MTLTNHFISSYRGATFLLQFVIQDEVQGFHWNNSQRTLHPVVTYYEETDELKNIPYCVISDDRKHDVALVYEVQKVILADLKC